MMNNAFALAGIVIKELYRRKDFYVLFILTALLTLLLGSINFFNEQNIARYVKEFCLLLIWIASLVIAVTTTARQIPAEREQRTIFPLLAKPVSRGDLIFGKFLGCWIASGIVLVVFYVFFAVITGAREHHIHVAAYFQAFWMHWMMLGVVVGMVLLGSIVFAAPSSNSTISFVVILGILLVGRHLNKVADSLAEPTSSILYTVYYVIPHLEFYDLRDLIVHNAGSAPWWAVGVATIYAMVYAALFQFVAWMTFRRKALN
ncbi:MAG: ABC transporter permease subunit [Verrucomicrobia bacterium]|nr:ABC transporter permease subunit [Verrucomicrobiota bacterium]